MFVYLTDKSAGGTTAAPKHGSMISHLSCLRCLQVNIADYGRYGGYGPAMELRDETKYSVRVSEIEQ